MVDRGCRTKAQVEELEAAIYVLLRSEKPMTLRQLFYRLVSSGVIEKTERQYKAVGNRLTLMRKAGIVPYHWLADSTRWMRKPSSYSGIEQALPCRALRRPYSQALVPRARNRPGSRSGRPGAVHGG